jgi:fatty-acyl-CoA synthase
LAASLLSIGFKKGDRIGIWAPNRYEWVITQFATAILGLVQVNINYGYRASELEYALKKVECKGIILADKFKALNYMDMLSSICPELDSAKPGDLNSKRLPMLKNVIVISDTKFKYSIHDS